MKVYEAAAQAFGAEGVRCVFGMMGEGNLHWTDRMHRLGADTIQVRHEGAALLMAQGYARISGSVGVCSTTCGPGVTQLATSLTIASRSRTPIVVFSGETAAGDDDNVQRINAERFVEATEAGFVRAATADGALDAVGLAFYRAKLESRPIVLSMPIDVQKRKIPEGLVEDYVSSSEILQVSKVVPNAGDLQRAADLIASAERPVILVGRGAVLSGAGQEVLALADRVGALIATTLVAKNWLVEHPYHAGISGPYGTATALELFQDADLVIGVGTALNKHTTAAGYLYPQARVLHVDCAPHLLMGGGVATSMYLQSDAKLGLAALNTELARREHTATGYHTDVVKVALGAALDDSEHSDLRPGTVDPRDVCRNLDTLLPSEIGLILGGGACIGFPTMLFSRAREYLLVNQFFGSIGPGLSTSIGAVLGAGGKPGVLIDGDHSFMMYLAEFQTAVRHRVPLLAVLLNDQAMGSEVHLMRAEGGLDAALAQLPTPDLGEVGRALGGRGRLATTLDDVQTAAEEWLADPVPTILDVRIADNVISIPYRRLHFGQNA